jgi:hypothetical protein
MPSCLTLTNSTFCPENVFTCFLRISEQQRIFPFIVLIDSLFITEMGSAYCAVHTGYLYKTDYISSLRGYVTSGYHIQGFSFAQNDLATSFAS